MLQNGRGAARKPLQIQDLQSYASRLTKVACAVLAFGVGGVNGCANQPYAAADNHPMTPEEARLKPVLGQGDQRRIEAEFQTLAAGHTAVEPPMPAARHSGAGNPGYPGVRWSDVPLAVPDACADAEMAVVSSVETRDSLEYMLRTIEDYPGTLVIRRPNDGSVYQATATIGRFGDHTDRAQQLLKALDEQMKAYGRKRKIGP
jgi:hypothetical protein